MNCVAGDLPYCEPVTRECLLITDIIEGGAALSLPAEAGVVTPDSSVPIVDASAVDSTADE